MGRTGLVWYRQAAFIGIYRQAQPRYKSTEPRHLAVIRLQTKKIQRADSEQRGGVQVQRFLHSSLPKGKLSPLTPSHSFPSLQAAAKPLVQGLLLSATGLPGLVPGSGIAFPLCCVPKQVWIWMAS